jgi:hypothetical protein
MAADNLRVVPGDAIQWMADDDVLVGFKTKRGVEYVLSAAQGELPSAPQGGTAIPITAAQVAAQAGVVGQSYRISDGADEGVPLIFTSTAALPTPSFRYWDNPGIPYGSSVGVDVAPKFLELFGGVTLDAGSGNVMPAMSATVNAPTDVIASERMTAGGANAWVTTMTGASTNGEVISLATGGEVITAVHVGFSTGTARIISADTTITVNEMVRFDFDAAALVTRVDIRFHPPTGSGRYVFVTCVGQRS